MASAEHRDQEQAQRRAQRTKLCNVRAERRKQAALASAAPLAPATQPPAPPIPPLTPAVSVKAQASPPATLPGSCRPSAHHPWKRGRACVPKDFAKM